MNLFARYAVITIWFLNIVIPCFSSNINKRTSPNRPKLVRAYTTSVKNEYIVQLKRTQLSPTAHDSFFDWLTLNDVKIMHNLPEGRMFAVYANEEMLDRILSHDDVECVEHNGLFRTTSKRSSPGEDECQTQIIEDITMWGLSRIGQLERPIKFSDARYNYNPHGNRCVTCYVIDTGIDINHPEFENRAVNGFDAIPDDSQLSPDFLDTEGHGTHVAGIIASQTYGVAKHAKLVSVRVFDGANGSVIDARGSDIMAGILWCIQDHNSRQVKEGTPARSVLNLSLGSLLTSTSLPYTLVEELILQAIGAGIVVVTSVGNDLSDSCLHSPSRVVADVAPSLAVTASDINDDLAVRYTNVGNCTSIIAPGDGIRSTLPNGRSGVLSGTSQAAPFVSGAAALVLSRQFLTPAQVKTSILSSATDKINVTVGKDTPDLFLYVPCLNILHNCTNEIRLPGTKGNTGATGSTGLPGMPGMRGPSAAGTTGYTGPEGNTGNPGLPGLLGQTGSTGATGSPGIEGPRGMPGRSLPASTGATGEQGPRGVPGGAPGPPGLQGPAGPSLESGQILDSTARLAIAALVASSLSCVYASLSVFLIYFVAPGNRIA